MKNNKSTIIIAIIALAAIGFLIGGGGKNKVDAPAPDQGEISTYGLIDKPAPDFSLTDRAGKIYSLDTLRGKNIVLFFNEGLMCYPACWNQIIALSKDERFKNGDIVALSVVVDSRENWRRAADEVPELAQAVVVFDDGLAASKAFNVLSLPSSMHPGLFPGHTYVVIDKEGIVRHFFDDPNMGIRNDQLAAEIAKLN